jgi:hypothetical protein
MFSFLSLVGVDIVEREFFPIRTPYTTHYRSFFGDFFVVDSSASSSYNYSFFTQHEGRGKDEERIEGGGVNLHVVYR